MFCANCGSRAEGNEKFCAACGARLEAPPAPVQQAAAAVPQPARQATGQMPAAGTVPGTAAADAGSGAQGAPVPAPTPAKTLDAAQQQQTVKAFGVSLGFGMAAAAVVAIAAALLFALGMSGVVDAVKASLAQQMPSATTISSVMATDVTIGAANVVQAVVFMLVAGVGGSFNGTVAVTSSEAVTGLDVTRDVSVLSLSMPVSLVGIALLVGAAFGAFFIARRRPLPVGSAGAIASAATGVASGIVFTALGAIFRVPVTVGISSGTQSVTGTACTLSGATGRTFLFAFLLAAAGCLAGFALAKAAPAKGNVFAAAWDWAHRARGPVRTLVEAAWTYFVAFGAIAVVGYAAACLFSGHAALIGFLPLLLPLLPCIFVSVACFGVFGVGLSSGSGTALDWTAALFSSKVSATSGSYSVDVSGSEGVPVIAIPTAASVALLVVAVACAAYVGCRAAARNYYDERYAGWQHCWQASLAAIVCWLLGLGLLSQSLNVQLTALVEALNEIPGVHLSVSSIFGSSAFSSGQLSLSGGTQLWFCLLGGVWMLAIEAFARTGGAWVVANVGALWKLFAGGTVRIGAETASVARQGEPGAIAAAGQTPMGSVAAAGQQGLQAPLQPIGETQPIPVAPLGTQDAPTQAMPVAAPMGGAQPMAATAVQQPHSRNKGAVIGVCAGLAALVLLGIAYAVINANVFSAKSVASQYLTAIETGDLETANGMADPGVEGNEALVVANEAAQGGRATMANVAIKSVTKQGDNAIAVYSYTLDGERSEGSVQLVKRGHRYGVFDNWQIAASLATTHTVAKPAMVKTLSVNGVDVSASVKEGKTTYSFVAYPGVYDIEAADTDYYTAAGATVTTGDGGDAAITVEATDALEEAIETATADYLDECAKSTDAAPESCPFEAYWYDFYDGSDSYDVRNPAWQIVDYPTLENVDLQTGTFSADGGSAKFVFEYRYTGSDNWQKQSETDSFWFYGTFQVSESGLEVGDPTDW